jgi:hypothetical protein
MSLTLDEIHLIFDLIRDKYGPGYAHGHPAVMKLQAKLSIMGEAITKRARATGQPGEA